MKTTPRTKLTHVMIELKRDPIKTQPKAGAANFIGGQHGLNEMKRVRVLMGLVLAVAVMFLPHAAVAKQGGTDILHFMFSKEMTNTGVDSDARGKIQETLTRQGNANNQGIKISLAKLNPNTAYQLIAFIGEDTSSTSIAEFTTDRKGSFTVAYVKKGQGNPSPRMQRFPDALDPLCNVRELNIINGSTETVLRAVLTSPTKGQYLVKRNMSNPGFLPAAMGEIRINATPRSTQFRLLASHLSPSTAYQLTINGSVAQSSTSDNLGKLDLTALPPGSPNVLDIHTLALTDATGAHVVLISGGLGIPCTTAGQATLSLGAAANFAVLAGSTVTSSGATMIKGNLGVSPGTAVTGFPPGLVNGAIHAGDSAAAQAQLDLTTAYNAAAGRTVGAVTVAGNLGGLTLAPGLYKSTSSLEISSGDLTLDAQGDAHGVFIFQMASTLTTTAGRKVILSGGAKASNVYWQVGSSATLGTTSVFKGTIMADQSITLTTGATLDGRALARVAAVTMDSNIITVP